MDSVLMLDRERAHYAAYMRIGVKDESTVESTEILKAGYRAVIHEREKAEPSYASSMEFYIDRGDGETNLDRLLHDFENGAIDVVLARSFSRFAVSIEKTLEAIMRLRRCSKPIGIYFMAENLFTLDDGLEASLRCLLLSYLAEEESRQKSRRM